MTEPTTEAACLREILRNARKNLGLLSHLSTRQICYEIDDGLEKLAALTAAAQVGDIETAENQNLPRMNRATEPQKPPPSSGVHRWRIVTQNTQ